jgi:GxxExxY protein
MELIHQRTSEKILRGFYNVYNNLGYGFSEKVYENALVMELSGSGLICNKQKQLKVHYNGQVVGEYFADIIVDDSVILELKSASALIPEHEAQLLNYLRATEM